MNTHICPSWLSFFLEIRIRKTIHDPHRILKDYVKPGYTVVDMGCGPGYFSIPMAKMVGKTGKVLSVDVQEKMLKNVNRNAVRHNVQDIIKAVQCKPDNICINEKTDFVLTFWMVHEVVDIENFMKQIYRTMKPGSFYLLSEPKIHVSAKKFREIIKIAEEAGFKSLKEVKIFGGRNRIFTV
jgi:ubiquinone/menaquinone biosynthesis C-methylase UbiE